MIGKAAAGLAALGPVGEAGTVVLHANGDATVKIGDEKVELQGSGKGYSCPADAADELKGHLVTIGRIKLTMRRRPNDGALVLAHNVEVDKYNATLERECEPSS